MDWLQGVFNALNAMWSWVQCFFPNLWCQGSDFFMSLIEEILLVVVSAISLLPLPAEIANFQWPDSGPLGTALIRCNVPQALTVLSSAFTLRFLKGLIPLIRS